LGKREIGDARERRKEFLLRAADFHRLVTETGGARMFVRLKSLPFPSWPGISR
jgi:hypothetical protein